MRLSVDADRAELRGPRDAIDALLAGTGVPGGCPPLLAAGLEAARTPLLRTVVTGLPESLDALAGARAGVLRFAPEPGELALRGCTPSGLLGQLVRVVGLRPRPRPAHGPVVISVAALARASHSAPRPGSACGRSPMHPAASSC